MRSFVLAVVVAVSLVVPGYAAASLDVFLKDLNIRARSDGDGFISRVSAHFGIGQADVKVVLGSVDDPADVFMIFQLAQWSHRPHAEVVKIYRDRRGRGWGELAQSLGIKPGSAEFHALKRGDFRFDGDGRDGHSRGGKSDDHGRGNNKGNGKSGEHGKPGNSGKHGKHD